MKITPRQAELLMYLIDREIELFDNEDYDGNYEEKFQELSELKKIIENAY